MVIGLGFRFSPAESVVIPHSCSSLDDKILHSIHDSMRNIGRNIIQATSLSKHSNKGGNAHITNEQMSCMIMTV
jgi:hypothetical protein